MNSSPEKFLLSLEEARVGSLSAMNDILGYHRHRLRNAAGYKLASLYSDLEMEDSDIAQEAIMHACRTLSTFKGRTESEFSVWLDEILRNVLIDFKRHYRREKRDVCRKESFDPRSPLGPAACCISLHRTPEQEMLHVETVAALEAVLATLRPDERQLFQKRTMEGCSFQAVAAALGITENAAQKRHQDLKQKIANRLNSLGLDSATCFDILTGRIR